MALQVSAGRALSYRLWAQHLSGENRARDAVQAAAACGLQNSPPGAWEWAAALRTGAQDAGALRRALEEEKALLQAWSIRGVPLIFPAGEDEVFLAALAAQPGEEPWIYTRGAELGLRFAHMGFDEALALVEKAAALLDGCTVRSKEALDARLAEEAGAWLDEERRALWNAPSMYGAPDRQTVGGAIVSFLLRPCAFRGRVVFGARCQRSPTFTSLRRWLGRAPHAAADGARRLTEKYLHCYGPAAPGDFAAWLGATGAQARRLWDAARDGMAPVTLKGKTRWMLARDMDALQNAPAASGVLLLGAHDAWLDARDRALLLGDAALRRRVWPAVAAPGAVLQNGQIAGVWTARARGQKLDVRASLWRAPDAALEKGVRAQAERYAAFRGLALDACRVEAL